MNCPQFYPFVRENQIWNTSGMWWGELFGEGCESEWNRSIVLQRIPEHSYGLQPFDSFLWNFRLLLNVILVFLQLYLDVLQNWEWFALGYLDLLLSKRSLNSFFSFNCLQFYETYKKSALKLKLKSWSPSLYSKN